MRATPEPGASRIVDFSGEPERWWNLSRPDCLVISRKMTGAPSTKPPAVMGRDFASFTGAWAPPVDMPEGFTGGGDCGACGFGGADCCSNARGAKSKNRSSETNKPASQFERYLEWSFICRPRVEEVRRLEGFGRRGRSSTFGKCRWASGFRWIARRLRRRGRSARACRWKKDSCPPWKR